MEEFATYLDGQRPKYITAAMSGAGAKYQGIHAAPPLLFIQNAFEEGWLSQLGRGLRSRNQCSFGDVLML